MLITGIIILIESSISWKYIHRVSHDHIIIDLFVMEDGVASTFTHACAHTYTLIICYVNALNAVYIMHMSVYT